MPPFARHYVAATSIFFLLLLLLGCGSSRDGGDPPDPAVCGNGVIESGEVCDDGTDNGTVSTSAAYCTVDCAGTQLCGNGTPEGTEACDGGDSCRLCTALLDEDSDGIADRDEGSSTAVDTDGDGTPDYQDTDADDDGVLDVVEAGDAVLATLPIDTDGDGTPDYRDRDSDADGQPDADEIACSSLGVDGRLVADSDGDGYDDVLEIAVGSNPCDAANDPLDASADFAFVVPLGGGEQTARLELSPSVDQADIFFNIDTTGSMGGEIANLKNGLSSLMTEVAGRVSDPGYGVGSFDDFPLAPYGSAGDVPFSLVQGITTDTATAQTAVNSLTIHSGNDFPESGYEALFQVAAGTGISGSAGTYGPWTTTGRIGGGLFRTGSLPIVLHITDALAHDATCPSSTTDGMTFVADYPASYADHSKAQALTALQAIGASVVTVQAAFAGYPDATAKAQAQLEEVASTTGAVVPVCAFKLDATSWRCGADTCCDGTIATGSNCILRYAVADDGTGLTSAALDGIAALLKYRTFDVYATARDDGDGGTPDTSLLISRVEALTPDSSFLPPAEPERSCTPVPTPASFGGSPYNDGFTGFATGASSVAAQGARLAFALAVENTTIAPTTQPQLFEAFIDVIDNSRGGLLATQRVVLVVPAVL